MLLILINISTSGKPALALPTPTSAGVPLDLDGVGSERLHSVASTASLGDTASPTALTSDSAATGLGAVTMGADNDNIEHSGVRY